MRIFAVRKLTGLPLSLTGLRKVRATQSIPLPNGKQSETADKRRRKQPPQGKGEKVGQEPTRPVVTQVLCALEVASSCIPASEGCSPEPEGRTRVTTRLRSHAGDGWSRLMADRESTCTDPTEPGLQVSFCLTIIKLNI